MISHDIRKKFLQYFQEKGHTIVPSSAVVPHDDPTLLFTNAGMNQFKDIFLGKEVRDYSKAASSQKCIRVGGKHNDLDNVGHTSRHLTFFEMLGNFSFGDYFKADAIRYAWEVATTVYEFNPDKIWVTVFETDDEAFALWEQFLPQKRISRMGEKDNFWSMGDTGPCGPCSELFYDRGSNWSTAHSPKEDATGERFLEFWNLVFMQFNRTASGDLLSLPKKSIDTGSGLERVIALKMGVDNVFATDIFVSLITAIENLSGVRYAAGEKTAPAFHVIADHLRSLSFAIADGVQPSNLDRGYVLRKLLRRAVRYGRSLGLEKPFLAKLLPTLIQVMGSDYKELKSCESRIEEVLTLEEEAFLKTLKRGGNILGGIIDEALMSSEKKISGEEAFKLKDTYGFPLEEITLLAKDAGLRVDLASFENFEEEAKKRSKVAHVTHHQQIEEGLYKQLAEKIGSTEFSGYQKEAESSSVMAIVASGHLVDSLSADEEAILFLNDSPFYAERGGQVGDTGTISHQGAHFTVHNTTMPYPGLIAHVGKLEKGTLLRGEPVEASIDASRREKISQNHTATHLLHWALHKVLGAHIRQTGSLVDPSRLRFDFSHHKPLTFEEIREIEKLINDKIRANTSVRCYEIPFTEAQKKENIKQFFGDKYGSVVRVVDIDYSQELCGGTHVDQIGRLGFFRVVKESSIAAGMRRLEAVCGLEAEHLMYKEAEELRKIAMHLKAPEDSLYEKVKELADENKRLLQEIKNHKRASLKLLAEKMISSAKKIAEAVIIAVKVDLDTDLIPLLFEELSSKKSSGACFIIASEQGEKCSLSIRLSPDLVAKGLSAVKIIGAIAPLIEGSGGGKEMSAQAGGKNPSGIPGALMAAEKMIESLLC